MDRMNVDIKDVSAAIKSSKATYDLAGLMSDANHVSCSGFGDAIITKM